jgi:hypothetical protein
VYEALSMKTVEVRVLEKVLGKVQAFWLVDGPGRQYDRRVAINRVKRSRS